MAFITERKLSNVIDTPISQPATEVKQGDWVVVSTLKLVAPGKITYRFADLNLLSSTVPVANIDSTNEVNPNRGLAYLALYLNYTSGSPANLVALDIVTADDLGVTTRSGSELTLTTAGNYSWLLVNNMQGSSSNSNVSTDIVLNMGVTGVARLDLEGVS